MAQAGQSGRRKSPIGGAFLYSHFELELELHLKAVPLAMNTKVTEITAVGDDEAQLGLPAAIGAHRPDNPADTAMPGSRVSEVD